MQKVNDMTYGVSRATVGWERQSLGWTAKATRYCQLIRELNEDKHVEFCQRLLSTGENFHDIIFTDESMVQLVPSKRKIYHKKGQARKYRPTAKHPVKVYICGGGISKHRATPCVIFTGTMDGERCTWKKGSLPFVRSKFPTGNYRFQQDNILAELPNSFCQTVFPTTTLIGGTCLPSHQT